MQIPRKISAFLFVPLDIDLIQGAEAFGLLDIDQGNGSLVSNRF